MGDPMPVARLSPQPTRQFARVGQPSSHGFTALLDAYRSTGGAARGEEVARLLEGHHQGDYLGLARRIVAREVFGFKWRSSLWMPMFQFDPHDLSVRSELRQVLAELSCAFDGWELAAWFVEGNTWLAGRRPVDTLYTDLPAVRDAARADRFIAAG